MDFSFSDDQQEIQQLARRIIGDHATHERLKEVEHEPDPFDRALWSDLAKAGLLGLAVPEEYGGSGLGLTELCLLCEESGRAVARIPLVPTLVMGALPLARFGPEDVRRRDLPAVVAGDLLVTAALEEPLNEDPMVPSVTAERDGGSWRLDGVKIAVPYGALAGRILVPAMTGAEARVFVLDPGADGVRLERQESTNLEPHVLLEMDGASTDEVLEGGAGTLRWILDRAIAALCAVQSGVCDGALRMTAAYTSTREQFDRPLAANQAVAQRAADAYIDTEAVTLTAWQAIWRLDEGLPAAQELAVAKFWAAEGAQRVVHAAQHLHGGIGVDVDYPVHRYFLWAKQLELTLGAATPSLLRLGAMLADEAV